MLDAEKKKINEHIEEMKIVLDFSRKYPRTITFVEKDNNGVIREIANRTLVKTKNNKVLMI
ncbi:MAG: hypothetical protein AB7V25_17150 [Mangrovibacterium sp.]